MNKKRLAVVIVAFCLIAALVTPMVLAYTTNDVYSIVKDIRSKVNAIYSKLCSIQSTLDNLYSKLWSASNSIKNDTLVIIEKLENVAKMESFGDNVTVADVTGMGYYHSVEKSKPFKVTLTIKGSGLDSDDQFHVCYSIGNLGTSWIINYIEITNDDIQTHEFVCQRFSLYPHQVTDGFTVCYSYVIMYSD